MNRIYDIPEPRLEPEEEPMLLCPVCGCELNYDDRVYVKGDVVIGCENCIMESDAESELSA